MSKQIDSSLSPEASASTGVTTSVTNSVTHGSSHSVNSAAAKPRLAVLPESTPLGAKPPKKSELPGGNDLYFTYIVSTCGVWEEPPQNART